MTAVADSSARLNCAGRRLDLDRPRIMGVLNITPDSFSDGGQLYAAGEPDLKRVHSRARDMIEQGADILDVGGESTRPGAEPVPRQQEIDRVVPVVQMLRQLDTIISVDTRHAEVAAAAIAAGAHMINDVSAGRDSEMLPLIASTEVGYCLMHMQGEPRNMQSAPQYGDVVGEVADFLQQRHQAAVAAGVCEQRLIVDPGFGFGKTLQHNLSLLNSLPRVRVPGSGLLVGLSRKSMLGTLTGQSVSKRTAASVTAAVLAAERGANILRVHDVADTRDGLNVWLALRDNRQHGTD